MADQSFVYVCTGSETPSPTDFKITLPTAQPDDHYYVSASLAGVTTTFAIDLPNSITTDRTTTQFRVRTSAAVQAGYRIEFHVYDPQTKFADGTRVDQKLNALLAAQVRPGGLGRRFVFPQGGPFYLEDTIVFSQVAGQVLVGQGAQATRFVWRGPSDRPAFDLNRCQDCGLGHFSLEVGDRVGTDKSVDSLTRSGTTATARVTAHTLSVGQFVYISGANQPGYNGRWVVATVLDANTFTFKGVSDTLTTPATGVIITREAAGMLAGIRLYNSNSPLTGAQVVVGQLSSKNVIEKVFLKLDGQGKDGVQIVWDPISTMEKGKNDHHRLTNVQIQGYSDSGIVFQGDQPQDCVFDHCIIQGRDTGLYGINAARPTSDGVFRTVGFFFRDGTIMENRIADIYYCRNYGDLLLVDGCHSEGSVRFFDMPNFAQDTSPLDNVAVDLRNVKHHAAAPFATVQAIHADTDTLDVTTPPSPHPFVTGDRVFLTTTGTLPNGLATGKEYWVINVDSNTIALALTRRNAMLGVRIDILDEDETRTHTVHKPEAAGEAVRYYGNGPFTMVNCILGRHNEPANRYRVRAQARTGERVKFSFHSVVSHDDASPIFTAQLPTDLRNGYRHKNSQTNLPLIDIVDNGRQHPATEEDWLRVLGVVPRSWYLFGERHGDIDVGFASVDATANAFNVNNHQFVQGDGPVRISTTGTLPNGLSDSTDYWIITDSSGRIAFAISRPDALTGKRVEFSDQGEGTHTIDWGSPGFVYDCNTRLKPIDLVPNGSPLYRQSRTAFNGSWVRFLMNTVNAQLYLNNTTEINPLATSVAFLIHFADVTFTSVSEDQYLCALGNGATESGGGPNVRFSPNGALRANLGGIPSVHGIHDYRDNADHLLVAGYNRWVDGVFTLRTELERINVGASLNVGNDGRKGLGTGLSTGTFKTASFRVGLFAVFIGRDAEELIAMDIEVHTRMGWRIHHV